MAWHASRIGGGLRRRTALASGLLALLIGSVFAVLLVSSLDQRDARRLARHSRAELTAADRLQRLIVDVETGQRGFLIARDERFLDPWRAARAVFPREARELAAFVDDPAQAHRARQIARDGTSYIADYSLPLVDAARRNDRAARSDAVSSEGKRRVDALRGQLARFAAIESASVAASQQRVDDAAQRLLVAAASGLGLSIVLIALFAGYLGRAVIRPVRRAAAMAGQLAGGDLAVQMPDTGIGEVGELERAFNTMGRSLEASRDELRQLAEEQGALRRVATLVARAVPPDEVWDAVVAEVDQLLSPDSSALLRYEPEGTATVVAVRSRVGPTLETGTRVALEGDRVARTVRETGRPARLDIPADDPGALGADGAALGIRSAVGAPVVVEGRVWGVIVAAWTPRESRLGTEARITEFTELVATAIANAESQAALTASRARVIATADETRRRIERDLHDGAQQRLVHTLVALKLARRELDDDRARCAELLDEALEQATSANDQLRELVHGILPAVLTRGGLRAGVDSLASRAPLPVSADITAQRLPPALEANAYFILAEALTNVIKHAGARSAQLRASLNGQALHLEVRDDGVGGARLEGGSGLLGLQDRAAALNGQLRVDSPVGGGTVITVTLPVPDA